MKFHQKAYRKLMFAFLSLSAKIGPVAPEEDGLAAAAALILHKAGPNNLRHIVELKDERWAITAQKANGRTLPEQIQALHENIQEAMDLLASPNAVDLDERISKAHHILHTAQEPHYKKTLLLEAVSEKIWAIRVTLTETDTPDYISHAEEMLDDLQLRIDTHLEWRTDEDEEN